MASEPKRPRVVKDPVHDQILLTSRMSTFIDSRAFQRLRNIKQLGTTYFVWLGASHNRFEHSIGVAHLSRLMVTSIQKAQPELGITERDIECVTLAGLCHDLGHGPWSHFWDGHFMRAAVPGENWSHEEGSEMMLDFLIDDKKIDIAEEDVAFIKALIAGDPAKCMQDEKPFLFEIVANKRNGLDVDKLDYIQRDSLAIGDPIKLQVARLIESARVMEGQICYEYKDLDKVFEVYTTRHKLHKTWYNHKTATAIDFMLRDALLLADPILKLAEKTRTPEEYLYITDDIMNQILMSNDSDLKPSQDVLRRILNRDLYRCVDQKWLTWGEREVYGQVITEERILQAVHDERDKLPEEEQKELDEADLRVEDLKKEHIIVEQSTLHYGMKEKNPLEHVMFYSKNNGNCFIARDGDYSTLRPYVFAEVLLRIFTKKREFHGMIQRGYRRIPDLDQSLTPGPSPNTVAVAVAEGGHPIQVTDELAKSTASTLPSLTIDSDAPMSPPVTEQGLEDDSSTSLSTLLGSSRHASAQSIGSLPDTPNAFSTAATAGSPSLSATPKINASPKFSTPGASQPLSSNPSSAKITTENRFTTVPTIAHGSPIKRCGQASTKKRNRAEAEAEEMMSEAQQMQPANKKPSFMFPGDREHSPSPSSRKHAKRG